MRNFKLNVSKKLFTNAGSDTVDLESIIKDIIATERQDPSPLEKELSYSYSAGSLTQGDNNEFLIATNGSGASAGLLAASAVTGIIASNTFSTGTTSAGSTAGYFTKSVIKYAVFGRCNLISNALVTVPVVSDDTDTFTVYFTIDSDPNLFTFNNSCVGIRYTHNVNGGRWQGFSRTSGGVETTVDLNIPVVALTSYLLKIEIDTDLQTQFSIDNIIQGIIDTNPPSVTACGTRLIILKSVGTNSRLLRVHNVKAKAIFP